MQFVALLYHMDVLLRIRVLEATVVKDILPSNSYVARDLCSGYTGSRYRIDQT